MWATLFLVATLCAPGGSDPYLDALGIRPHHIGVESLVHREGQRTHKYMNGSVLPPYRTPVEEPGMSYRGMNWFSWRARHTLIGGGNVMVRWCYVSPGVVSTAPRLIPRHPHHPTRVRLSVDDGLGGLLPAHAALPSALRDGWRVSHARRAHKTQPQRPRWVLGAKCTRPP